MDPRPWLFLFLITGVQSPLAKKFRPTMLRLHAGAIRIAQYADTVQPGKATCKRSRAVAETCV